MYIPLLLTLTTLLLLLDYYLYFILYYTSYILYILSYHYYYIVHGHSYPRFTDLICLETATNQPNLSIYQSNLYISPLPPLIFATSVLESRNQPCAIPLSHLTI